MDFFRILLIVGGGYFVLKALGVDVLQGIGPLQPSEEPPAEGEVVPTDLPGQPTNHHRGGGPAPTVADEMLAVAMALPQYQNGLMGYDHWNWVYKQVTGAFGPNWETVVQGRARDELMSLADFLGYTELGGLSGMGTVEATRYERSNVYFQ